MSVDACLSTWASVFVANLAIEGEVFAFAFYSLYDDALSLGGDYVTLAYLLRVYHWLDSVLPSVFDGYL